MPGVDKAAICLITSIIGPNGDARMYERRKSDLRRRRFRSRHFRSGSKADLPTSRQNVRFWAPRYQVRRKTGKNSCSPTALYADSRRPNPRLRKRREPGWRNLSGDASSHSTPGLIKSAIAGIMLEANLSGGYRPANPSMVARSSAVIFHRADAALRGSWSGRVAPAMTLAVTRCAASQETASVSTS